jgi:PAS domain S-box-containing protein
MFPSPDQPAKSGAGLSAAPTAPARIQPADLTEPTYSQGSALADPPPPAPPPIRHFRRFVQAAALLAVSVGMLVELGWMLGVAVLTSVLPGLATMKPNTAACFILAGLALWLLRDPQGSQILWGLAAGGFVACLGLLTATEYWLRLSFGIDELLFRHTLLASGAVHPGRMSLATALGFTFVGLSLFASGCGWDRLRQGLGLLALLDGLVAALGYAYGSRGLYSFSPFSSMAIHTALLMALLGMGSLASRPRVGLMAILTSDFLGGLIARRILPLAVLLPILLGWLCWRGQLAGVYGAGFGLAVFTLGEVVMLAAVLILGAYGVNRADERRRRAEETDSRLAAIVESSLDAIVGKDLNGTVLSWNRSAEQLFGYSAAEMVGRSISLLIPPERQHEESQILGRIRGGQRVEAFETVRLRKDGQPIEVSVTISPVRDRTGRVIGASKIARNISRYKQAERALQKQAEELARSNRDLEQFAYAASHDLQEPLRAVTGCMHLFKARYAGKIDERGDEFITHAVDGATRMQKLIDDLLSFSRVGTSGAEFRPVECAQAVEGALKNLSVSLQEQHATVERDELPLVWGDLSQLSLLFQNLIGNALKFHGPSPPRIHISARRGDGEEEPVISVRDNGIGIELQYFERIFVIFQRLHTRKEYPGTGMGLALCKRIVERHGGRIWVESEMGKGTTFCFTLRGSGSGLNRLA